MADDAALARGIHRLQHEEDCGVGLSGTALGEEALLQLVELLDPRCEVLGALLLAAREARRRLRVDVGEAESLAARAAARAGSPVQCFWLFAVMGPSCPWPRPARADQRGSGTSMSCRPPTGEVSAWSRALRVVTRWYSHP